MAFSLFQFGFPLAEFQTKTVRWLNKIRALMGLRSDCIYTTNKPLQRSSGNVTTPPNGGGWFIVNRFSPSQTNFNTSNHLIKLNVTKCRRLSAANKASNCPMWHFSFRISYVTLKKHLYFNGGFHNWPYFSCNLMVVVDLSHYFRRLSSKWSMERGRCFRVPHPSHEESFIEIWL